MVLKISAWKSKASSKKFQKKANRVDYNTEPDTDLSKRCMADILGTISIKRSLIKLLVNALVLHLKNRDRKFSGKVKNSGQIDSLLREITKSLSIR